MAVPWILILMLRLLMLLVFKLVRGLILLVQNTVWYFDGTAMKARDAFKPDNYDSCVRVLDIKARYKFDDVILPIALGDFIYTHNRFENPNYIRDTDHVSLINITSEYALFGEAREKGMELWKSDYNCFIKLAQLDYCNKLLIVPLYAFNRMADELGDPAGELIFVFNVSRCGSTLFTQMMEYTGQCVAISEPEAPNLLNQWYRDNGDSEELRQITKSSIRWICRPYNNFKPLAYVVKLTPSTALILNLFKEVYHRSHFLFMYRDMLTVAKSVHHSSSELLAARIMKIFGRLHESVMEMCIKQMSGIPSQEFRYRLMDDLTFGLMLYIYMAKCYLDFYHKGTLNVRAIRYEDIISDPVYSMKTILNHCNLPESLADNAVKGMEHDSQRNSPLSRKNLQRHRPPIATQEGREAMNKLAKKQGVPTLDEDSLLPGTITTKPSARLQL